MAPSTLPSGNNLIEMMHKDIVQKNTKMVHCSFKDEDDWTHLTKLIEREPNYHYYWTGLKRTWYCEFSDGTSTDYAENIIECEQNHYDRCFSIARTLTYWSFCGYVSHYFICQVNKGNQIYRSLSCMRDQTF